MARFSDAQLIQIMEKAARRINRRLSLFNTSEEIAVDASGCISPNNGVFQDLVLLQAECMIAQVDINSDIQNGGLEVVDGEQSIDISSRPTLRINYLNSKYNPCEQLEEAIKDEQLKRAGNSAKMVW